MAEELHQLKGAGDSLTGNAVGRAPLNLFVLIDDASRLRSQKARYQVEQGVFVLPLVYTVNGLSFPTSLSCLSVSLVPGPGCCLYVISC